jgi:hypothetical protein
MRKVINILSLFIICATLVSFVRYDNEADKGTSIEENDSIANIILVGINHPAHPSDNIILPRIGDSLCRKSPYFNKVYTFKNGREFIEILKTVTKKYGKIGNLAILGHSGYQGYFVEASAGFHRNEYTILQQGRVMPFSPKVSKIKELGQLIEAKEINFSLSSVIVLVGCNTAYGEDNIAFDLADITNLPVIGSNQKVDLYNVRNQGEEMKGIEEGTFYSYIPDGQEMIKYDLCRKNITVTKSIEIVKERIIKLKNISSSLIQN